MQETNQISNKPIPERQILCTTKKYKCLIKQECRKYEQNLTLESLYQKNNNNTEFWKCLKSMTQNNTNDDENSTNLNDLINQFEKLPRTRE